MEAAIIAHEFELKCYMLVKARGGFRLLSTVGKGSLVVVII